MGEKEQGVLKIAVIYPELLGTYGDGGNGLVLVERARLRGYEAELTSVAIDEPLPDAQIYLLGGGEDGPQRRATEALHTDRSIAHRLNDGALLFAVCAGLQIVGISFAVEGGSRHSGLGLVPLETVRGEKRRVGEILVDVDGRDLVGFENHAGHTYPHDAEPLGLVKRGYGNDGVVDGVYQGGVIGTYAHGPVLAMNQWLADELLGHAIGHLLEEIDTPADRLYEARRKAVRHSPRTP